MDLRQPAGRRAQGQLRIRAVAGLARSPAPRERAVQRRRLRIVRQPAGAGADQPPRRRRSAAEALHAREELHARRLLCADRGRGAQVPRPRAQRAHVDGGRHQARRLGREARHDSRPKPSRHARRPSPPSRKRASRRRASARMSSRSTTAASTGSIATSATPTSASSLRRNSRSRSSAAIPTTSRTRATTSISRCFASTRTASRSRASTT